MAKTTDKRVNDWFRLSSTQEYLKALNNSIVSKTITQNPAMAQPQGLQGVLIIN